MKTGCHLAVILCLVMASAPTLAASDKHSFGGTLQYGIGKMGNGQDVPDRKMNYMSGSFFYGYSLKRIRVGAQVESQYVSQNDNPSDYNNQNLSGIGASLGVRLDYYDGRNSFGVVYKPAHIFRLEKSTLSGEKKTYEGNSGVSIQYMRAFSSKVGFVLEYAFETFSKSIDAPSDNVKWDRISLGLVISNFKKGK